MINKIMPFGSRTNLKTDNCKTNLQNNISVQKNICFDRVSFRANYVSTLSPFKQDLQKITGIFDKYTEYLHKKLSENANPSIAVEKSYFNEMVNILTSPTTYKTVINSEGEPETLVIKRTVSDTKGLREGIIEYIKNAVTTYKQDPIKAVTSLEWGAALEKEGLLLKDTIEILSAHPAILKSRETGLMGYILDLANDIFDHKELSKTQKHASSKVKKPFVEQKI